MPQALQLIVKWPTLAFNDKRDLHNITCFLSSREKDQNALRLCKFVVSEPPLSCCSRVSKSGKEITNAPPEFVYDTNSLLSGFAALSSTSTGRYMVQGVGNGSAIEVVVVQMLS